VLVCVGGGLGIVSQLSSEGGPMLAGISSVLWSGIVSCNTHGQSRNSGKDDEITPV
jgi:hypothetical protein